MKMTKKLLAVAMVLSMVAAFMAIAFAANPRATFTVGEYADGKAAVSVKLVDCVGLTSGSLNFGYEAGKVTKIAKKNGQDAKNIGDIDNAFAAEFNPDTNPAEFGFYFKNNLWSSEEWAADDNADAPVNGESFEAAVFTFTAEQGAVITVTGELKFGDTSVAVSDSFTISGTVIETTTAKPVQPETTTAKPVQPETTTAKPVQPETTTAKPVQPETTTAKPVQPETTTAKPVQPETTTAKPVGCAHDLIKVDAKAATCTIAGNTAYYTCTKCGKVFSDAAGTKEIKLADTVIPSTSAHKWDAGKITKVPTSKEDGLKVYTCTICGAQKQETIDAKGVKKTVIVDNNRGITYVCSCGDKNCKCQNKDCTCRGVKCADNKCGDPNCKCNAAAANNANNNTKTPTKTNANVKTDGGKKTGDNGIIAIVAGVVALAGAAFVVTKKRK